MMRPYLPGDMWQILPHIREVEIAELHAMGGTVEESLRYGIAHSDTVTLELNGKVAGLLGMINRDSYWLPWAVFTNDICDHKIAFLRATRKWVSGFGGPIMNVVDARNTKAIHWLKWMGFDIGKPEALGVNGEIFHTYRKGA